MDRKIKVLAYCDSPTCATGFGTVSRNIFQALYSTGKFDIDVLGINYWGDPHNFPYRIWPTGTNAEKDPYGRKKVCNMIPRMEYDLLFFLQDTFILDFLPELMAFLKKNKKNTKSICYFPVDGVPKAEWIRNVSFADELVAYSEFGREQATAVYSELNAEKLHVIPHGVNTHDFYIHKEEDVAKFRASYFGPQAEKFIFTNLNRNQQRKDIPRTIQAFKEFKKRHPDSLLYLHMAKNDQGWNLLEVCRSYGLSTSTDVIFPENFGPNQGYPLNIVNMIYNCSDAVMSTTLGEGWGLSWIEAMATRTPVIMPANTALIENITDDRGYLVKSGGDPSLYTVLPHDNEVIRPLVDVNDLIDKMEMVYSDREGAAKKAQAAYDWVTTKMDWQGPIAKSWVKLFEDVAKRDAVAPEEVAVETDKVIESEQF